MEKVKLPAFVYVRLQNIASTFQTEEKFKINMIIDINDMCENPDQYMPSDFLDWISDNSEKAMHAIMVGYKPIEEKYNLVLGEELNKENNTFLTAYYKSSNGKAFISSKVFKTSLNLEHYQFTETEVNDLIDELKDRGETKLAEIVEMSKVIVPEEVD